jgi:glycosyltransferase involved in cell wall biosynthesis
MKIAFIVQRYGSEVLGGSEQLCRLVAERLSTQHEVDVLTTCARDYVTWKNEYPEGSDRIKGVTVRRFASARTRDLEAFNRYSDWIYNNTHTRADEMEWLKQQGPWCPALVDYLRRHQQQYDVLVFFTYLYATTVLGLEVNPGKSVLVSTAHDEPAIRLDIYKEVFGKVGALCYLTEAERQLVRSRFPDRPLLEDLIGVGVDLPNPQAYPRMPSPGDDEAGLNDEPLDPDSAIQQVSVTRDLSPHVLERGSTFKRRHRMPGPIVLYGGRIDPGKGCEELLEYFASFVKDGGDATLALMGAKLMSLPEDPRIRFAGMLSETERTEALEAASVVICPSPYESLSLLALESFAVGTPVLANARSEVLVDHCHKSNAGLFYADRDEFTECLRVLVADQRLRNAMGRNGRHYVRQNYRWDVILAKYERMFSRLRQGTKGNR